MLINPIFLSNFTDSPDPNILFELIGLFEKIYKLTVAFWILYILYLITTLLLLIIKKQNSEH